MWFFNFRNQLVYNTNDPAVIADPDMAAISDAIVDDIIVLRDKCSYTFARGENDEVVPVARHT